MRRRVNACGRAWLWALLGGAAAGIVVLCLVAGARAWLSRPAGASEGAETPPTDEATAAAFRVKALEYTVAVQTGDCERLTMCVQWMRERLKRANLESGDPAQVVAVRDALCARAFSRPVEGNQIRNEGIEDQYILTPAATVLAVGADAGRGDLEAPVARRIWLRVTFPGRETAPLDKAGRSIRALSVGVNMSQEGYVLKAGVAGNLDLDGGSLAYW